MSKSNPESEKESKVEVYERINRLKIKAGGNPMDDVDGKLDPTAIDRANTVIQKASRMYPMQIRKSLERLNSLWDKTKAAPKEKRKETAEKLANTTNHIKDLAAQFNYDLMDYFGTSLRDYILAVDLTKNEHVIIVQAHIDVMNIAYNENLRADETPLAAELQTVLAEAIAKHS
jgi:hypothetical protein